MSAVSEIETVDDQYCFCLRQDGRDLVLFAFRTEADARIAAEALRQIAERAVAILPAADVDAGQPAAESQTGNNEDTKPTDIGMGTESTKMAATSPFLGR